MPSLAGHLHMMTLHAAAWACWHPFCMQATAYEISAIRRYSKAAEFMATLMERMD